MLTGQWTTRSPIGADLANAARAPTGARLAAVALRSPPHAAREAYDDFVVASPQGSLFCASWWLEAVAPGRWRTNAVEEDGAIVAAWPTVVVPTRWGPVHGSAPVTPFLGPLFAPRESAHRRRSAEIEGVERLLAAIGDFAHLDARCNPGFDYWTPLAWHGFEQTTHYTWRLPDLGDLEAVWTGLRENVRREIRKARKRGVAVSEAAVGDFLRLRTRTARRRGDAADPATIERVDEAAAARGARTVLVARDPEGRDHAAAFLVHDERWTYYLLGASEPELRTSGAASLVMWDAIERAAARGTGFDFEGSMLRDVERFFRAFGGVPTPYSVVRKTPSLGFRTAWALKRIGRRLLRAQ